MSREMQPMDLMPSHDSRDAWCEFVQRGSGMFENEWVPQDDPLADVLVAADIVFGGHDSGCPANTAVAIAFAWLDLNGVRWTRVIP